MKCLRSFRLSSNGLFLGLVLAGVLSCVKVSATSTTSNLNTNWTSASSPCFYTSGYLGDGVCDGAHVNNEECGYDGGDCCSCTCKGQDCGVTGYQCVDPSAACVDDDDIDALTAESCMPSSIGDGYCQDFNNEEICRYDGGDCCSCTCEGEACGSQGYACIDPSAACVDDDDIDSSTAHNCLTYRISDGYCNQENNKEICGYDGGDCCSCTCVSTSPDYYQNTTWTLIAGFTGTCGDNGYQCIDPNAACVDDDDVDTMMVEHCGMSSIGDGFCDDWNNNELCNYDGGDCCSCTCVPPAENPTSSSRPSDIFGVPCVDNLDCIDPEAACVENDPCGEDSDYHFIGDGSCSLRHNSEQCGYDGGDCCESTCVSSNYYNCGENGYACIDPNPATSLVVPAATFFATFAAAIGAMRFANAV